MRFVALMALSAVAGFAADGVSVARQNQIVQTYCAVCHTDASRNGGLTLEHFDAATATPSLKAMLLTKITQGTPLATVRATATKPEAAAFVEKRFKTGAFGASGVPEPELAEMRALALAWATGAQGAEEWVADWQPGSVSILREVPSPKETGAAESYRVILSCDAETKKGSLQLTWSPIAKAGKLAVTTDSRPAVEYVVSGREVYGNGSGTQDTLASLDLAPALPAKKLMIRDGAETVSFPFDTLPDSLRRGVARCFPLQSHANIDETTAGK